MYIVTTQKRSHRKLQPQQSFAHRTLSAIAIRTNQIPNQTKKKNFISNQKSLTNIPIVARR